MVNGKNVMVPQSVPECRYSAFFNKGQFMKGFRLAPASACALLFFLTPVCSANELPEGILPVDKLPQKMHSIEDQTAAIRKHHLKRLDDRLNIERTILHQTCKYESEISTPPPHKRVVLSFDDGPELVQTEYILDVLKKHNVSGTFFLIGEKSKSHPELVAKIIEDGHHTIGNHSWDHPNFHDISAAQQADEVLKFEETPSIALIKRLFRYPYGNSTCDTNNLLHSHGYQIVGWHVDSCDWAFDKTGSVDAKEALSCGVIAQNRDNYIEHVVSTVRAHQGGIVLMHEIHPNTLKKLNEIISHLKEEGFTFGSIEDPEFVPSLR